MAEAATLSTSEELMRESLEIILKRAEE